MQNSTLECEKPLGVDSAASTGHVDRAPSRASAKGLDQIAFGLFILLNAVLFIRPAEIVPALEGIPFYGILITACLAAAIIRVVPQFSAASLVNNPITVCVLGLLLAAVASHLSHASIWWARTCGFEFLKLVIYYLLLVGVVNTVERLNRFLFCLAFFIAVLTVLALLQYHHFINIPSLAAYQEGTGQFDELTGAPILLARLCSTGIFNDPNDLCLVLIFGAMICLYRFIAKGAGPFRTLWLMPVGLFGYALMVTHSRGGFLALLASVMVLFIARFGWQRAIPLATAILPVMFVLFAGRATHLSASDGTGQDRIKIWSDSLQLFKRSPIFGIGMNRYVDELGVVAHNSFIHSYAELGFFGGTLFIGAFYYAVRSLYQLGQEPITSLDPELRRLRPFILGIVAAYITGFMTLSRSYVVPAYLVLGLVTVYLRMTSLYSLVEPQRLNLRVVQSWLVVSVGFVIVAYAFVRTFARFG